MPVRIAGNTARPKGYSTIRVGGVTAYTGKDATGIDTMGGSGDLDRTLWDHRSGGTVNRSGGYLYHNQNGGNLYEVYKTPVSSPDMVVDLDIDLNPPDASSAREAGPIIRMGATGTGGIRAVWDTTNGGRFRMFVDGVNVTNATLTNVGTNTPKRLTLEGFGSRIRLYADGIIRAEITTSTGIDNTLGGFYAYNAVANSVAINRYAQRAYVPVVDVRTIPITPAGDIAERLSLRARSGRNYIFDGTPASNAIVDHVNLVMAFDSTPGPGGQPSDVLKTTTAKVTAKYVNGLAIYDSARHGGSPSSANYPHLIRTDTDGVRLYIPFFDGGVFTQYAGKIAEPEYATILAADANSDPDHFNGVWMDDLLLNWKVALAYDSPEGAVDFYEDPTLLGDFLTFFTRFKQQNPNIWICANLQPTRVYSYLMPGQSNYDARVAQIVEQLDGVWIEYGLWYDPVVDRGNNYNLTVVHQNFAFVRELQRLRVHALNCHVFAASSDGTTPHPVRPREMNVATSMICDDGTNIVGDAEETGLAVYDIMWGAAKPLSEQVNANLQPTNTVTGTLAVSGSTQCTWRRDFAGGIVFAHYGPSGTTYTFDLPQSMVDYRNPGGTPFTSISFNTFGDHAFLIPAP